MTKYCGILVGIICLSAFILGDIFSVSVAIVCCLAFFAVFGL